MTTYLSVNRHTINRNTREGRNDPPIRISRGKYGRPLYGRKVVIDGPSMLLYQSTRPILKCGARLVIATEAPVTVLR